MEIIDGNKNILKVSGEMATERKSRWYPNKVLQGYRFSLHVRHLKDFEYVKNDFVKLPIEVRGDPKHYRVTELNIPSHSYQGNQFTKGEFEIYIEEEDILPEFSSIEINGSTVSVIGYRAHISSGSTVHSFLLELDKDSFDKIEHVFIHDDVLSISRQGVDEKPLEGRLGGSNYWSRQSDESGKYVRIFNFIIDLEPPIETDYQASALRTANIERQVLILNMQMEYLIKKMGAAISEEDREILATPQKLSQQVDADATVTDFEHVGDAEKLFNSIA